MMGRWSGSAAPEVAPTPPRSSSRGWTIAIMLGVAAVAAVYVLGTPDPKNHTHSCPGCGHGWAHDESQRGDPAAHQCPKCGAGPIWIRSDAGAGQLALPAAATT